MTLDRQYAATNLASFGLIPTFLSNADSDPLWKQIDKNYVYGGGWRDVENVAVLSGGPVEPYSVQLHPDDPPFKEQARLWDIDTGETIVLLPYGFVFWTDGVDQKAARID